MKDKLINTGSTTINQVITVILSTSPFLGGFTAAVLDNLIKVSFIDKSLLTGVSEKWLNNTPKTLNNSAFQILILKMS